MNRTEAKARKENTRRKQCKIDDINKQRKTNKGKTIEKYEQRKTNKGKII